jgi:biotin carboxylase
MNTSVMILAAGPLQLPGILEAKALGLRTIAVDGDSSAPGLAFADKGIVANILDPEVVADLARAERIDALFTLCTEAPIRCLAAIASRFGLPALSKAAAYRATDKRLMREAFATAGAPSPRFKQVHTLAETQVAAAGFGYPVALKIARGAGSRGIYQVRQAAELGESFAQARTLQSEDALLIEEWVEGCEVSVEGFVVHGSVKIVAVTDKEVFRGAHPVESGHSQPSQLDDPVQQSIRDAVVAGVHALELDWTTFHAELKISPQGPRLIEIGARLGGDRISTHLTPISTGVNLVRCGLLLALGETPVVAGHQPRGAAIRYFDTGHTGRLKSLTGVRNVYSVPELELLYLESERGGKLSLGSEIGPVRSSLDRYGHVLCSGTTAGEAIARAERVRDMLVFSFVDGQCRTGSGRLILRSQIEDRRSIAVGAGVGG